MHVVVSTPPEAVVTLDEAKVQLRVDFDDDDALIQGCVGAATALLDGPLGSLRRSIGRQTLTLTVEGFWGRWCGQPDLRLPYPPLVEVTEISYVDPDGADAIVDPAVYTLTKDGYVRLAHGKAWPSVRSRRDSVTVTYTAGFDPVPAPIRQAILMITADLYANRGEAVAVGLVESPLIGALLRPYGFTRV